MKRYSGIYGELLSITDENTILKIYEQYNGTTITFPKNYTVRVLFRNTYVKIMEFSQYKKISRYLNLSSRRVMQIAKEEGVTKAKTNAQEEIY